MCFCNFVVLSYLTLTPRYFYELIFKYQIVTHSKCFQNVSHCNLVRHGPRLVIRRVAINYVATVVATLANHFGTKHH